MGSYVYIFVVGIEVEINILDKNFYKLDDFKYYGFCEYWGIRIFNFFDGDLV